MTEDEVRANLIDVIAKTKPKGFTRAMIEALVDATMAGARKRGIAIVSEDDVLGYPDEHLKTLKNIRRILLDAIEDTESKRDLSSLTKRLSDVSKEVVTIEERHRAEKAERGGSKNGSSTKSGGATASAQSGPLSI